MTCNVGRIDRTVRFIAGIVIIVIGVYYSSWWGALGLVFIVTALVRWCPLYLPFKINTAETGNGGSGSAE